MRYYLTVASVTIFLYDYFLTLGSEIDLIWSSPWNAVKILYFLARYMPFIDLINMAYHHFTYGLSEMSCTASYKATGWLFLVGMSVAEGTCAHYWRPLVTNA
ncbi:hypothetical protein BDQ17DRAFT_346731 [Cyathus striatus]|nr:hypothetical protein BDQ17DRAFT_346731 [Cyathus striatus]